MSPLDGSAYLHETPRSRMDVLRDLAPDLHAAVIEVLVAVHSGNGAWQRQAHGYLATAVQAASDGRGWRELHLEQCERHSPRAA